MVHVLAPSGPWKINLEPKKWRFAGWWQLKHVLFSPRKLGKISNLTNICQMGWNHQLVWFRWFSGFQAWVILQVQNVNFLRCNSGQNIASSHDLTPKCNWGREIPLFQGNLGWWNIIICQCNETPCLHLSFHLSLGKNCLAALALEGAPRRYGAPGSENGGFRNGGQREATKTPGFSSWPNHGIRIWKVKIWVRLIGSCGRVDSTSWKIMKILVGFLGIQTWRRFFFVCSVNLKRSHRWNHGAAPFGTQDFPVFGPKTGRPAVQGARLFSEAGLRLSGRLDGWGDGLWNRRCLNQPGFKKKRPGYFLFSPLPGEMVQFD